MSFVSIPRPQRSPIPYQILAVLIGGILLFVLTVGLISGAYQLLYDGRVFPGVSMAGVDLTSKTPGQVKNTLNQHISYPTHAQIVFRYLNQTWVSTPAELGMVFDAELSVQRVYNVGRQGGLFARLISQLNAWNGGLELNPVFIYDERVAREYLQKIASQIDQPVVETDLYLDGTNVVYTQGQTGRLLNVDATLANLMAQLYAFKDGDLQLVVEEQSPLVLEASSQAGSLRQILSAPLAINIPDPQPGDPGPWTIEPSNLAGMLSVARVQTGLEWQYQVSVDAQALENFLTPIAPLLNRSPQNARFYFDDPTGQLVLVQSAVEGRSMDLGKTLEMANQKLLLGEHSIPLIVTLVKPDVTDDATAASLGITGLVKNGSYTSYFRGSSSARLQNIRAAASRFYGLLIPPNSTFSMGNAMGDISLDNGYAEALIIFNGKTITGVGGGVCQVSTTLFRTALFSGYPIVERHEHAYRVYYYEQTATGTDSELAGLDATVYFPLVDLKFTNDRPYWLLMETYFHPESMSLEWKFYSGDDGRTVDVQNLGLRNVIPAPEPLFEENPDLIPGEIKQVDWPGDGADIMVTRVVSRSGLTLFSDSIQTHYEPWQAVCQYGPGTDDPKALAKKEGLCQ